MCRRIKVPRPKKQTHWICLITPSEEHLKSELGVWGFFLKTFFFVFPYMCLISLDCSVLLCFLSPLTPPWLLFLFVCLHHWAVVIMFLSSLPHFLFLFLPTWCHPSPLISTPHLLPNPPTHPRLSLSFIRLRSQRHCQTGGGVKRRWAPGDPRGAFQWQGPQVKITRAEPLCSSDRLEENKSEGHSDMVSTGLTTLTGFCIKVLNIWHMCAQRANSAFFCSVTCSAFYPSRFFWYKLPVVGYHLSDCSWIYCSPAALTLWCSNSQKIHLMYRVSCRNFLSYQLLPACVHLLMTVLQDVNIDSNSCKISYSSCAFLSLGRCIQ